jgi:hypothetical protein
VERAGWLPVLALVGCAYVSREEYLSYWDEDEDGWPLDEDCAPTDPAVFPFAADPRGDGCDSDCGEEPDADGDDWPDAADCAPDDPSIFPCSPTEVAGDLTDHDCDGEDSRRSDPCSQADPDYPDVGPVTCRGG